ncbi:hypothetical protein PUNSTDRAFT_111791 [Punctularia strigosozonata HHB-11173 SS5]|uniref:uncharacterized protein n=1 Tax=Punctularia strigosozonata (strain HHB-11173) TaxID=741275 RepID=UPI0004416D18|nr:uncharacterized protein PUNSTDRAFT_111791 [Punctularia strigosozonata HHB-11173 SS5]EIN11739.1 hypothetical protein PUNSTDRAFT_111791 [Punctularia strigosozonata HHB-11173 SS5]
MATTATPTLTTSVLGKRTRPSAAKDLVIHLAGSDPITDHETEQSDDHDTDWHPQESVGADAESEEDAGPSTSTQDLLVYGPASPRTSRKYACTYEGCTKAYTKLARLAEHERIHTGERPYICKTCHKSYTRETHLQAHARTHLPNSSKPFFCKEDGCAKRFWTAQHLARHLDWHNGEKPFKCPEPECGQAFSKQHQLRSHFAGTHAPESTKSFICAHAGCTKSFATTQKLRAHQKVHEDKRYTCVHPSCLATSTDGSHTTEPTYYPRWTALQHHVRTAHPPTCPHSSCNGKTFKHQRGLRAHLKLHEEREAEGRLDASVVAEEDAGTEDDERPVKRRRGGEYGRDWKCEVPGCTKDFKSQKALDVHNKINHLGRRDFVCAEASCGRAFGYKHLLQRHTAKVHASATRGAETDADSGEEDETDHGNSGQHIIDIDDITGLAYSTTAQEKLKAARALRCPHPHADLAITGGDEGAEAEAGDCEYVFTRAYDLRRHLKAVHGVEKGKEEVDRWMRYTKARRALA